jgi:hypothetical protein
MSSAILLVSRNDRARVTSLLQALMDDRQDVRLVVVNDDADPPESSPIDRHIVYLRDARALVQQARAVVAVWSDDNSADTNDSHTGPLQILAKEALDANTLLNVTLDGSAPPPAFIDASTYDLSGSRLRYGPISKLLGGHFHVAEAVKAVGAKIAGLDPPPFGQTARRLRRIWGMAYAVGSITIGVLLFLLALDPLRNHFANQPSSAELSAWNSTDKNDCAAVRDFVTAHRQSPLVSEARAILDGRRVLEVRASETAIRKMPLYVGDALAEAKRDVSAARQDLTRRTQAEAESMCRQLAEAGGAEFVSVEVVGAEAAQCHASSDGNRCVFDGQVACVIGEPRVITKEECGLR